MGMKTEVVIHATMGSVCVKGWLNPDIKQFAAHIIILRQDPSELVAKPATMCSKIKRSSLFLVFMYVIMHAYACKCVHNHVCLGTFLYLDAYTNEYVYRPVDKGVIDKILSNLFICVESLIGLELT